MTRSVGPSRDVNHVFRTLASLPSSTAMGPAELATIDSLRSTAIGLVKKWDDARDEQSRRALVRSQRQAVPKIVRRPEAAPTWTMATAAPVVGERSKGRCEHPDGCDARAQVIHHRKGRGFAGCHHPDLLLHLCDACHVKRVHAHPEASYANGSMLHRNDPVTPHVRDEPVRAGSQDRETPE